MTKGNLSLYAVSFCTNAAILIFEIAGGRHLAPYLGTSVDVWAGTIAVVLGGMALGYHIGGKIGDRDASPRVIVHFLFGAGLAALIAWAVRDLVPQAISMLPMPLTLNALVVGTILYMPTVILLAIVSPLLAKNLITKLDASARVVGTLNAVGTAGSIVGAITTGLFLIPALGIDWILLSVAAIIFALALLMSPRAFMNRIAILALIGIGAAALNGIPSHANIVADVGTTYNRIVMHQYAGQDGETLRAISTDPFGTQCAMEVRPDGTIDEDRLVFRYLRGFAAAARYFVSDPAPRVLFLGGCNYSFPRAFLIEHPEAPARVVEIDPGMTKAAIDHFAFAPSRFPTLSITHQDARIFLNRNEDKNDIIFMDTFGSSSNIPAHLTTQETFARLKANLADGGILLVNIIGIPSGPRSEFASSLVMTARTVFSHAELYAFGMNRTGVQNLILAAGASPLPEAIPSADPEARLFRVDAEDAGIVLTDAYAPVEHQTRFNRER